MKTKTCTKCGPVNGPKLLRHFAFLNKDKGLRQSRCRDCYKETSHLHYIKNKDEYHLRKKAVRSQNSRFLFEYFLTHPCTECGENDPLVLEFDHLDRSTKSYDIGLLMTQGYSWTRIMEEASKCRVLCRNCHQRHTIVQQCNHRLQWMQWMKDLKTVP